MTRVQALSLLLLGQLALCAWTRAGGFLAISDDDYARVVIAQAFAESPKLDPSGTSWLPFPFWLTGLVFKATQASLAVARALAFFLASAAALLLYQSGRLLGLTPARAVLAALACAALPTIRPLTVSTTPEFWAAALVVYASASLLHPIRWRGAAAVLVATACRYEAWPAAAAFAGLCFWDALHQSQRKRQFFLCGLASVSFIAAWMIHGVLRHGSPLFFVQRVAAYKAALGADSRGWIELLFAYPLAVITREPEVTACVAAAALSCLRVPRRRNETLVIPMTRFLAGGAATILVLVAGDLRGGAPTHHPERALVAVWMTLVLAAVACLFRWGAKRGAAVLALCVAAALPFRLRVEPQYYAQRDDEEAVGREVSKRLPHEVAILATTDFGYFAIQAAARHPSRFVVADRHDPREASSAEPLPLRVLALARSSAACFAVVPLCVELPEVTTLAETSDYRIVRFANEKCVDP